MTSASSSASNPAPAEEAGKLPAELQQLQAEAAALEQNTSPPASATPGAEGSPQGADDTDWQADAEGMVNIASETLGAFYPSTEPILSPDKRAKIAGALAPVLQKHGWSLAWIFGKWGEEIQLAFVCSQVAIPLAKAIRRDRELAKAQQQEKPAAPPPPAASAATTPAPPASTPAADLYAKA